VGRAEFDAREEFRPDIADTEHQKIVFGDTQGLLLGRVAGRKPAIAKPGAVAKGQGPLPPGQLRCFSGTCQRLRQWPNSSSTGWLAGITRSIVFVAEATGRCDAPPQIKCGLI